MAQLVARLVRNEKVGGSNPPSSTTGRHPIRMSVFCMPGRWSGAGLLCCSWRRWCSGRRRARPLYVPVGGGPPARSPHASLRLGVVDLEARPGPTTAHGHRGQAIRRPPHRRQLVSRSQARHSRRPRAPQPGPPDPPVLSTPATPGVRLCRLAPHPPCMRYKVRPARTKLAKTGHFERAGRVLYRTCNEEGCAGRFLYRKRGRMARAGRILSRPPAPSSGPEPLHRH